MFKTGNQKFNLKLILEDNLNFNFLELTEQVIEFRLVKGHNLTPTNVDEAFEFSAGSMTNLRAE